MLTLVENKLLLSVKDIKVSHRNNNLTSLSVCYISPDLTYGKFLVQRQYNLMKDGTEVNVSGPLAQSAERGADNAKVVSLTLTRTNISFN